MVFDFCLYDVSETKLTDLHVLNHPCELGMSLGCGIRSFLCVVGFEFADILLRILKSVFIKDVGL